MHATPLFFRHTCVVVLHEYPGAQSELPVQVVVHMLLTQEKGEQSVAPPSWQLPFPSQVWALLSMEPAQFGFSQTVPEAYSLHARLPSHIPLRSQVPAPSSGHSLSGSVLTATAAHVPLLLHLSQKPPQRTEQHTLSVQKPLAHSPSVPQPCPMFLRHWWEMQVLFGAQSALVSQDVLHAPAEHTYGAHNCDP
jgi:hypothetical protein